MSFQRVIMTGVMLALFGGAPLSRFVYAEAGKVPVASPGESQAEEVGNKNCPVNKKEISGRHFGVVNGKKYGFCCSMCRNKFMKQPEMYLTNN